MHPKLNNETPGVGKSFEILKLSVDRRPLLDRPLAIRAKAQTLLLASTIGDLATAPMLHRVLATLCVRSLMLKVACVLWLSSPYRPVLLIVYYNKNIKNKNHNNMENLESIM